MRVIALIAAYNERRFITCCLNHLYQHGIHAYLIDNCSLDNTVELAEPWLDRNLIGIESLPRPEGDFFDLSGQLQRKEELARELDADWFIHLDADELRLPPLGSQTLRQALETVDAEGFNAVDFAEFTFVPTREEPDHDHPNFQHTLRTHYAFKTPRSPHQLKAWKAGPDVTLASGGHRVRFPGVRVYPRQFRMKHYLILSIPHAIEKYVERRYNPEEVKSGWHGWRATVKEADIRLPSRSELLVSPSDDDLIPSDPYRVRDVEKPD
ncbi:MAG: glycosyltransferase family 2 protein [Solirubrobacterales bacterium]